MQRGCGTAGIVLGLLTLINYILVKALPDIISVSLPPELRIALDAEAKRQRRSRSFLVGEAIRAYVAGQEGATFAAAREQTLREALALSSAERVRLSENLWLEFARGREPAGPYAVAFDTFAQYEDWKRRGEGRVA